MKLIVVRHAHAGSRRDWAGNDRDRPLSELGNQQSLELARLLADHEPTVVASSPRVRCIQTVEPLAEKVGLQVTPDDRLDEGPTAHALLSLVDDVDDATVAWCSHGDVIPELLRTLVDQRGLTLPAQVIWPKASVWILEANDPHDFTSATFVPAPRP